MLSTACTDPQGTRRMPIESTARVGAGGQCEGSGERGCSSGSSSDSASEDSRAALSTARASSSAFRAAASLWYRNLVRLVGRLWSFPFHQPKQGTSKKTHPSHPTLYILFVCVIVSRHTRRKVCRATAWFPYAPVGIMMHCSSLLCKRIHDLD